MTHVNLQFKAKKVLKCKSKNPCRLKPATGLGQSTGENGQPPEN